MNDAGFKVNESTVLPVEHNKFFAVFLVRVFVDFRLREGTHIARVPLTSCKPEVEKNMSQKFGTILLHYKALGEPFSMLKGTGRQYTIISENSRAIFMARSRWWFERS